MQLVFELLVDFLKHYFFVFPIRVWSLLFRLMIQPYFLIENPIELFMHIAAVFKDPVFVPALPFHKAFYLLLFVLFFLVAVVLKPVFGTLIWNYSCLGQTLFRLIDLPRLMLYRLEVVFDQLLHEWLNDVLVLDPWLFFCFEIRNIAFYFEFSLLNSIKKRRFNLLKLVL